MIPPLSRTSSTPTSSELREVSKLWTIVGLGVILINGCATISPIRLSTLPPDSAFSHDLLDAVLREHVSSEGDVDYARLQSNPETLELYYSLLTHYSPDSHPQLFPTDNHELAYWINAYNAAVLTTVLRYYPVASVREISGPFPVSVMYDLAGFFLLKRIPLGGNSMSLYRLENRLIRKRYPEPRIHFALNCASRGCPMLPSRAFTAAGLEEELERQAYRFFASPKNFRIDHETKTIWLSAILDWYEADFLQQAPSLLEYVKPYVDENAAKTLAKSPPYRIKFFDYDWRLNDIAS